MVSSGHMLAIGCLEHERWLEVQGEARVPKDSGPCQSCKMSKCLHRSIVSDQILPQEKRLNRDKLNT